MPFDLSSLYLIAATKPKKAKAGPKVRRRAIIIEAIAVVAREAWRSGVNPTLLNFEGALIASLRAGLCLEGWGWQSANRHATEIVGEGLRQAGAKRPGWKEGQPEWTDQGVIRETRTRCAQCEAPLELGQKTFCSPRCANSHRAKLAYQDDIEKARAVQRLRHRRRRWQTI